MKPQEWSTLAYQTVWKRIQEIYWTDISKEFLTALMIANASFSYNIFPSKYSFCYVHCSSSLNVEQKTFTTHIPTMFNG